MPEKRSFLMASQPSSLSTNKGQSDSNSATQQDSFKVAPPAITLPKGGGAIRGIGEKFAANPVTGTGSMTVPLATSPGRSGFGPQLSLSYDSSFGNGPFGFGWSLPLPQITRKTEKGLPRYLDGQGQSADSDTFILSGSEDLVPEYERDINDAWVMKDGQHQIHEKPRTVHDHTYRIRRYRPRVEGLFARIERWTNSADASDVFWRSISMDNITTWYGKTAESRIQDPADPRRIFCWLICQTHDDKGNVLVYGYKSEDSLHVKPDHVHERNRTDQSRSAQRYLKRIRYGNRTTYFPELQPGLPWPEPPGSHSEDASEHWLFETVFDYDEPHYHKENPDAEGQVFANASAQAPQQAKWLARNDPFSSYRAGFEVRTYRLCQHVLMFHHFPGEAGVGKDCLVRSTDFTYEVENNPNDARVPIYSFLHSVTQSGYVRRGDRYLKKSLPPVEFTFSKPEVQDLVEEVDPDSLENLPIGLDGTVYQWTDLHGEGIPGILTEQGTAWYYKRNWSPIPDRLPDGREVVKAKFAALETVALKPNVALADGAQFMDLAGDGQPDVVVMDGPMSGLYEHDGAEGWGPFRPFTSRLNREMQDPNLKFIDLDGDGHADVLITEDDAFVWHPSLAEEGFGSGHRVSQPFDEEKGPRVVFADGTQSIYLADLSGDGLTDLIRIRNGEVCYWPNLGYGRFGAKVTMDHAPWFDQPDQFNQNRIRLADIDGSGTTDIIYLHRDGVRLYFNQSGNSWSPPRTLNVFPRIDDVVSIVPIDLLGNGTACLVWSSPLPGDAQRAMRYVNLMGGEKPGQSKEERARSTLKPHLLISVRNNLGVETRIHYAPSTRYYLQDRQDGKSWITRLPFPVHVVERVETYDHISHNRFVTRYAYHHGYFDGAVEREFRGFGMVEQWDTEEFAALAGGNVPADNIDMASHTPPVLTRTWFHTGVYEQVEEVSQHFASKYYGAPAKGEPNYQAAFDAFFGTLLPDTVIPNSLTQEEERESCRALKGSMLRQEVYALDGTDKEPHPYTVAEQNFTIQSVQPRAGNRHAVFFAHPREAITYHYERNPIDPRIQHKLTLEVDQFGNALKEAAIGYGRRLDALDAELLREDRDKQRLIHITCTENTVTTSIVGEADAYRTPLPAESHTYELRKPEQETSDQRPGRFKFTEVLDYVQQAADGQHEVTYEDIEFNKAKQVAANDTTEAKKYFRRLIEHIRTLYRKNDLTALLSLRGLESQAIPGESYKLAFTPGLLTHVFQRARQGQPAVPLLPDQPRAAILGGKAGDQGGYIDLDGDASWWIPSGRSFFDPNADIGNPAKTAAQEHSAARQHFYLPRKVADPFGHSSLVDYDAQDLLVSRTSDAIGNTVTAANDYRMLQPWQMTDPNRNRTQLAFDILGLVVATAVMGKEGENLGDLLEGVQTAAAVGVGVFDPDPPLARLQAFIVDPHAEAASLLGKATTRILYDLDRYQRVGQPPATATLARETHTHDPEGDQTKIQISFTYSDGFGREIQKKVQAEAGDAPQRQAKAVSATGDVGPGDLLRDAQGRLVQTKSLRRWVGTGRTIFNNKGKPVKQYEPFFSITHLYEHEHEMTGTGVSPILFYDPVERVVATLHPNHTYEKVVFEAWRQTTYDVNDTIRAPANPGDSPFDPKKDHDVGPYFGRLPEKEYLPPWYDLRTDTMKALKAWPDTNGQGLPIPSNSKRRAAEKSAAGKAARHCDTPTVAYFDTLGRPFLTMAHNRFDRKNGTVDQKYSTRLALDIEGNNRTVRDTVTHTEARDAAGNLVTVDDPLGRIVMHYDFDMLGQVIHQASMEAGERWMLHDVAGKQIRAWDSRGFQRCMTYDELRRSTGLYVTENGVERRAEETMYGESQGDGRNHRGQVFQVKDGAGIVTSVHYDFKGNLLESKRDLLSTNYKLSVDWKDNPAANDGTFTTRTAYDALSRPLVVTSPDGSIHRPTFNEANLLHKVDVNLRGEKNAADQVVWTPFVTNITYNAKGQRELITYGNGTQTTYSYDPLTFRLIHLKTTRPAGQNEHASQLFTDPTVVQDLHYTYDPVGNINLIEDAALKTVHHDGQQIEPLSTYTYDATYRLVEANGREHIGQTAHDFKPATGNNRDYPFSGLAEFVANANDTHKLRYYTEHYEYDEVGNFQSMRHIANGGSWTRTYTYDERSLIEDGRKGTLSKTSNRLSSTSVGGNKHERYVYDAHGSMIRMPHLAGSHPDRNMQWDYRDQLCQIELVGGGTVYYVYDAGGQRVRKIVETKQGRRQKERIYLGGLEVYCEYNGNGSAVTLQRESLHLMDDDQRLALVDTQTIVNGSSISNPSSVPRYQLGNHLGSASVELSETGGLISYEEYHPYGTPAFQAGHSAAELSLKRYRFTGKERDEESGLYYYGARYYAAWLGKWISTDRSGLLDGVNLYRYGRDNPVVFGDPDGCAVEAFYISAGRPGKQRFALFAGIAAHKWIAFSYKYRHLDERVFTNQKSLKAILAESGAGDPKLLRENEEELEPDITNTTTREVFEIKPAGKKWLKEGRKEVKAYLDALNRAAPANAKFRAGTGESGELFGAFAGGRTAWRLKWWTTEPGVIQYSLQQQRRRKDVENETYEELPWVDIDEATLEQHAEEFLEQITAEEQLDAKTEVELERDLKRVEVAKDITLVALIAIMMLLARGLLRPVGPQLPPSPPMRPIPRVGPTSPVGPSSPVPPSAPGPPPFRPPPNIQPPTPPPM
jgi:RHS repeat-associated protein